MTLFAKIQTLPHIWEREKENILLIFCFYSFSLLLLLEDLKICSADFITYL